MLANRYVTQRNQRIRRSIVGGVADRPLVTVNLLFGYASKPCLQSFLSF